MIHRGNIFLLTLDVAQNERLSRWVGVCRLVWNLCLEQRRDWYRQYQRTTGDALNWVAQSRELTALRAQYDWISDCPQESTQRVTAALHRAFEDMWRSGKGFPKPKKRGNRDAISFNGRYISIEPLNAKWSRVRIPKLGWIKFRQTRPIEGKITEAVITRTAQGWQISFGCKIDRDVADVGGIVGIDRGVVVPVALSDGQSFALPSSLERLDKLQRRAQRIASRRKRGSKRHTKAQQRVRNIAAKCARIRKDWAHRTTTAITRQYGTVIIERLRTKQMTKSAAGTVEKPGRNVAQKRGLNRAILNVGWFQLERMLAYKAFKLVKVNPAYSSQTCSSCETVDSKSRKNQASFVCTSCGHQDNADRNAASIILQRGNTALLGVEGCGCAPVEASTAVMATAA
jgi:putative transposase